MIKACAAGIREEKGNLPELMPEEDPQRPTNWQRVPTMTVG
jgi:hypothetical protein